MGSIFKSRCSIELSEQSHTTKWHSCLVILNRRSIATLLLPVWLLAPSGRLSLRYIALIPAPSMPSPLSSFFWGPARLILLLACHVALADLRRSSTQSGSKVLEWYWTRRLIGATLRTCPRSSDPVLSTLPAPSPQAMISQIQHLQAGNKG